MALSWMPSMMSLGRKLEEKVADISLNHCHTVSLMHGETAGLGI